MVKSDDGNVYRILELIGTSAGSVLYRASCLQNDNGAVLKVFESGSMSPDEIACFRSEYENLQSLDLQGVAKPIALVAEPRRLVMILENIDGKPLEAALGRERLDWPACLRLACQLTDILAGLHAAHIVHRDFRPVNMMLSAAQNLCLVDLSRAIRNEPQTIDTGNQSVADWPYDWAYVSPEQTGRMNRTVDYRTDFYSLGVTLYRMLTGQLPCHGNDALEWVHCHIARLPRPPAETCPGIPPIVSAIAMKLLAKMPEDRYQSAHGLLHDLEACLTQWEAGGTTASFALGTQDWSERIQISHKLVGREFEVKQLLENFDAVAASGRAALLLISGYAGVGKSALVHELHQPILERRGYFISGKFDQYQRDIPYATVTQAFRELVQQVLAESEARIGAWCRQILDAVGANGQLIVDVLPQVALIIGHQKSVPELPPAEAQNRFLMVFEQFIGVFAQQAHPLTLFLDDLQWADAGSLRLVGKLVASFEPRFLLVVGAYRDNEVSEAGPAHPLTLALSDLRSEGVAITQIALTPLSEEALSPFIDDMLQCARGVAAPLARLVYQKTAGNPFFVIQFMTALAEQGMLAFDAGGRTWRWDLATISAKGYTDNVAELMVEKLARLPAPARAVLQRLACLGSSALETTLVMVSKQPQAHTQAALAAAVHAGHLLRMGGTVRFSHDRVQEAAYLSMPVTARRLLHLQIGRLLMAGKSQAQIEESVFDIVSQFNRGTDDITDGGETTLLCHLNFLAGKKAKAAIAYTSARRYLERAMTLMPDDAWQSQYRSTFELTLALSECEYIVGNFLRADQLAQLILANAQSNRDRASVYRLRTQLYQMAGRYDDALSTMFEAAQLFHVDFPSSGPEMEGAINAEVSDIAVFLQDRSIVEFAAAPALQDADREMVMALLVETIPAAYLTRPDFFALITAKAVNLSLRHGQTEDACFAYSTYGMALLSRNSDIATAFEFSELALKLNQKLDGRRLKGRLLVAHALAFNPWKNSFASSTPILDQAFAASLEVGDLLYANFSALFYFWPMWQQGMPLDAVLHTAKRYGAFARGSHNDAVYHTIRYQQQLVASLKGQTRGLASLDDDDFQDVLCFPVLEKTNMGFGIQMSYIVKQISAFIYGDYASAMAAAQQASLKSYQGNGMILVDSAHHFYFALTLAALYPQASALEQRRFAAMLAEELERHKVWAEHCPQNFQNAYALVGAEIARIEGREGDAERLYEQAIRCANDNGMVQNEALAFELASRFYRTRGFERIADTYLGAARAAYMRWGADGKVAHLDARYRPLETQAAEASGLAEDSTATPLDVMSVLKASQAISGRLLLEELSDTLLQIVLQSAGAQTGSLLLCAGEALELAAQASVDQAAGDPSSVQVRFYGRRAPAEGSLPAAILNYVRHSREQVLLQDVAQPNPFSSDPYFVTHRPKSVLCLPILRQDALIGLLYVENNLLTHAFAPKRVEVLNLLASQTAISLENAQLFANLLQENRERKLVEQTLRESQARIRRLVESNIIGVVFMDISGGISEANQAFWQLSGYSRHELDAGAVRWTDMTPPEYHGADEQAIEELRSTGICTPFEKEYIRKDGSRAPVLVGAAMIEGSRDQMVCFVLDLSARKQAEEQMRHMANHDALTGLPNRVLFQERMKLAIAYAQRNHSGMAVLFIDLDYFKHINDSLGHHVGDVVLQMTAMRLQKCLREGDSVARLGGDEFVLSLPWLDDSSDAAQAAQKVLETLTQPFIVEGHELHVNASIGISLYPDDGTDVETLMRTADTAMYHAKEMGRGNFQFFTPSLNVATQQRLLVGARLRQALAQNEFVLYYQPQVNMQCGKIFSAEALLRWQPSGTQAISCGAFIGHAEESGLIMPIGEWALRQACRQLKIWHDAGHPELKVAVNLSTRQLEQGHFCSLIAQILEETGICASALELEITESILMQHTEANLAKLTELSDMGIQLSVDDFGTGYSSLSYLQRFPVQSLKIDQSFVRGIGTNPNDTALVTAIIAMATSLHLKVIAEGVETLQQAEFLLAHDCTAAQGFYYSKAVPAETLLGLLASNSTLKNV